MMPPIQIRTRRPRTSLPHSLPCFVQPAHRTYLCLLHNLLTPSVSQPHSVRPRGQDKRHVFERGTYLLPQHAQPLLQADTLVCAVLHEQRLRPELEVGVAGFADDVECRHNDGTAHLGCVVARLLEDGVDALAEVVVEKREGGLAWGNTESALVYSGLRPGVSTVIGAHTLPDLLLVFDTKDIHQ